MRALLDQVAVLEAARLALVCVANQIARIHALGQERPFVAGGEAGAAPTAQSAFLDQLYQVVRFDLAQGFLVARITASALVGVELPQALGPEILGEDGLESHYFDAFLVRARAPLGPLRVISPETVGVRLAGFFSAGGCS